MIGSSYAVSGVYYQVPEAEYKRLKELDNLCERQRQQIEYYEKAVLHWHRSYNELDAKETDAWQQVNQLKRQVTGLENKLKRQMAHAERLKEDLIRVKHSREDVREELKEVKKTTVVTKLQRRYTDLRRALAIFGAAVEEPFKELEKVVTSLDKEFQADWKR